MPQKSKPLSAEDELNSLPDASPEDQLNALPSATGLPSINKQTGPSMGDQMINAIPGGPLIKPALPGISNALEKGAEMLPGALKSTAKAFVSPENLVPAAAAGVATGMGQPELAPAAAAGASMGLEAMKGVKPPESIGELLTTASLNAIPGAAPAAIGSQVSPETGVKVLGQGAMQAGFEAVPFLGSGALKENFMPEISNTAKKIGAEPSLSQITRKSGIAGFLDFISEGVFASASKEAKQAENIRLISDAQKGLAAHFTDEITSKLTAQQIGDSLREGIDEVGIKAQKAVEDALYKRLDDVAGGTPKTVFEAPRASVIDRGYIPYTKRAMDVEIDPLTGQPTPRASVTETGNIPYAKTDVPIDPMVLQPVERRVGGIEVPTTDIKRFVQGLSKTAKSESAVRLVNNILEESRSLPFSEMQSLRSDLLKISRTQNDPSLVGLAKGLTGVVDKSMETTAKAAGDDVYTLWRNANEVTKAGYDTLKTDLTSRLILSDSKYAENVGEGLARKGEVTPIQEVKKAINRAAQLTNDPEYKALIQESIKNNPGKYDDLLDKKVVAKNLMDNVKSGYYNDLMARFVQTHPDYPGETSLRFGALQKYLEHPDTQDTMKELFTPEELNKTKELVNLGAKVEGKFPESFGGLNRTLNRMVATTGEVGSLGVGVLISKGLQHPQVTRYLTEGLKAMSTGGRLAIQEGAANVVRAAYYLLTGDNNE